MNKVTCNGCRHSANSIDKLRIHCSTDRHQGTLTMCHYLDTMLKEAEGLGASDGPSSYHLLCRPCSYQSKFVVEMVQHMQCQKHQVNVHQEQQRGGINLAEMIAAEPDQEQKEKCTSENGEEETEKDRAVESSESDEKASTDGKTDSQALRCPYCNYSANEENRLQLHIMTQHSAQPAIKCPICKEFLNDTVHFQLHLIRVHKLTTPDESTPEETETKTSSAPGSIGGILKAIHLTCQQELREEPSDNARDDLSPAVIDSKKPNVSPDSHEKRMVANGNTDDKEFTATRCHQCGETQNSKDKLQLHMELHRIQASAAASASSSFQSERTCTACQATFSNLDQLRQHLKTKHHIHSIQFGKENLFKTQLPHEKNEELEPSLEESSGGIFGAVFSNPHLLLTVLCSDYDFAQRIANDPRFSDAWKKLGPPYTCSPCQETFVSRGDLFDHIMASETHRVKCSMLNSNSGRTRIQTSKDQDVLKDDAKPHDNQAVLSTGSAPESSVNSLDGEQGPLESSGEEKLESSEERTQGNPRASNNFDFTLLSDPPWKCGRLLYPGISKAAHKEVLADLGLNQVVHFVENRSPENRERAKIWKTRKLIQEKFGDSGIVQEVNSSAHVRSEAVTTDTNTAENLEEQQSENMATSYQEDAGKYEKDAIVDNKSGESDGTDPIADLRKNRKDLDNEENLSNAYNCEKCGKEFSNIWVLKIHEKSVHNIEMSPEMLEEFVDGYSSWYWECAKKEVEDVRKKLGVTECNPKSNSVGLGLEDSSQRSTRQDEKVLPEKAGDLQGFDVESGNNNDMKGFQQAALQAIVKNYPSLLGSYTGASQSIPQSTTTGDEAGRLQQQMLLQMLMAAQAQAALQQGSSNQSSSNTSSIMDVLVDHIYASAAHGAAPPFMDPLTTAALLQQVQAPPSGMNPYHWFALRAAQQQQRQMQQLLMYPAVAGGAMPFLPGLAESSSQQQMLASLASNLLSPGMSGTQPASSLNSPLAAALQAYQLQAAAAAAVQPSRSGDARSGRKEEDASKLPRLSPYDNASSSNQNRPASSDLPAKRPRTRITDEQLKVLRANFDINTSPSENQIAEMAVKTKLPSKVIKHWFRNTLFKERQRSKDSPYNFNIPPMTSLEDVKRGSDSHDDLKREIGDGVRNIKVEQDVRTLEHCQGKGVQSSEMFHGFSSRQDNRDSDRSTSISPMPESKAMQILRSLSERSTSTEMQQALFSNALSLMPNVPEASQDRISKRDSAKTGSGCATESDRGATTNLDREDGSLFRRGVAVEGINFGFDRLGSAGAADYQYTPMSTTHGAMPPISRRTPRTRFSDYQLKVLQEFFDRNAYPKDEDLDKLSRLLDLSTRVIVVWFQNARQKARKSYEMQQANSSTSQQSSGLSGLSMGPFSQKRMSSPSSPGQRLSSLSPVSKSNNHTGRISEMEEGRQASSKFMSSSMPAESTSLPLRYGDFITKDESELRQDEGKSDVTTFQCLQCDAKLHSADALQEHGRLHHVVKPPSSYMASVIQQYGMFYPPNFLERVMQGSSASQPDRPHKIREGNDKKSEQPSSENTSYEGNEDYSSYSGENKTQGGSSHFIKSEPSDTVREAINNLSLPRYGSEDVRSRALSNEAKSGNHRMTNNATVQSVLVTPPYGSNSTSRDVTSHAFKRKISISPTLSMSSSSSTSPNGTRPGMSRKVLADNSKDPKRLRTTITPEQLEFLYQQYLIDSSPSRKVIEQISDIVGLKKRVVQVWFQNTRARERKGQFRSVGRITSVLGMPQMCPHCRVTFRTKADLDAHVRYRHMQSPSSMTAPLVSAAHSSTMTSVAQTSSMHAPSVSQDSTRQAAPARPGKMVDHPAPVSSHSVEYRDIMNSLKRMETSHIPMSTVAETWTSARDCGGKNASADDASTMHHNDVTMPPSSPKRRKLSAENESDAPLRSVPHQGVAPFIASSGIPSQKTNAISQMQAGEPQSNKEDIMQMIFPPKSASVDAIAQRLSDKASPSDGHVTIQGVQFHPQPPSSLPLVLTNTSSGVTVPFGGANITTDARSALSPTKSTSDTVTSTSGSPTYMGVPLKRYRTQMTSLQVRTLKHSFSEYKTPTLMECEALGVQIGLPKRVIQVWFQNARAKEKKTKQPSLQGDLPHDQSENAVSQNMKSVCSICPVARFGSAQEYRNHIFSKSHLQKFMSSCDGECSEADDLSRSSGRRTPSPGFDDVASSNQDTGAGQGQDNTSQQFVPDVMTSYSSMESAVSEAPRAYASTSNGPVPSSARDLGRGPESPGWDNSTYASILASSPSLLQKYQQFAAVQRMMGEGSLQNGTSQPNHSSELQQNSASSEAFLNSLKSAWLRKTIVSQRLGENYGNLPNEGVDLQQASRPDVNNNE